MQIVNILNIQPSQEQLYTLLEYYQTGRYDDAERLSLLITQEFPEHQFAWSVLGAVLKQNGKISEALIACQKSVLLNPLDSEAYYNLGVMLLELGRLNEAEASYKEAIALKPDLAEAHNNLGVVLQKLGRFNEAESSYRKTIELKPDYADAYFNLGTQQLFRKKTEEAVTNYQRAISLNPDRDYLLGTLIHTKMQQCMWDDLARELDELIKKINNGHMVSQPFCMLSFIDDPSIHRKCCEIYSNNKYPKSHTFLKLPPYQGHKKIKIGYFSPEFRDHPVGNLTAELYENHDREKFEIHAFSFGIQVDDVVKNRIRVGVDYFHDVKAMSDKDVVKLVRSLEIDIAIDLAGFTGNQRSSIFSMSAAPIQVSYLGYNGTLCLDFIDYVIVDRIVVPENQKKNYSEKIIYLPNSYMPNDSKIRISKKVFNRKDVGLPTDGFIFCCFNNFYKINPITFTRWMKILSKVEGSVLWLSHAGSTVINNLKKEAKKNGIHEDRLIFSTFITLREDHLSRIQLADLFLDTLPFNAHATTLDALNVGLPVLTCTGNAFAGRVATSLLMAVNLPEMITTTEEEYILLAIDLAENPEKLKTIKDKLINNLPTAPLFNNKLFTSHLEAAYKIMHEKNQK